MDKNYLGIDIGLNGALAKLENGKLTCIKMPILGKGIDPDAVVQIIKNFNPDHIIFEKLAPIFGTSKATAFSMGYQSGVVETACISLGIAYTAVKAKVWQKDMFIGVTEAKKSNGKRDTKAMALIACKRIFPGIDLTLTDRAIKPNDGYVDAILMAEWGKRHVL